VLSGALHLTSLDSRFI